MIDLTNVPLETVEVLERARIALGRVTELLERIRDHGVSKVSYGEASPAIQVAHDVLKELGD